MSIEAVREYLAGYGLEDRILEFDTSSATVELAAQALGCEPARIAKTLSFYGQNNNEVILVVCAGDVKVDNKKFREQFGLKARMLKHEDAGNLTGHAVGGVCPFAVKDGVKVYLDKSLQRFDTVYPAAGSSNSGVRLSCGELESSGKSLAWVDVTKAA